jgi:hypothetical protein
MSLRERERESKKTPTYPKWEPVLLIHVDNFSWVTQTKQQLLKQNTLEGAVEKDTRMWKAMELEDSSTKLVYVVGEIKWGERVCRQGDLWHVHSLHYITPHATKPTVGESPCFQDIHLPHGNGLCLLMSWLVSKGKENNKQKNGTPDSNGNGFGWKMSI